MALNLNISIPEDSSTAEIIQQVAQDEHITQEQAAARLLTEGAELHRKKTPIEELWGAFSSPEDSAILDEAMASVKAYRGQDDSLREFGS